MTTLLSTRKEYVVTEYIKQRLLVERTKSEREKKKG
jgi:hypothetical protein